MELQILIVEDERKIRIGLQKTVDWSRIGIAKVHIAGNAQEGLALYRRYRPQILLLDIRLPGMSGLEMCRQIRKEDKHTLVFMLTGHLTTAYVKEALSLGVEEYFVKPVNLDELVGRIGESVNGLIEQQIHQNLSGGEEKQMREQLLSRLLRDEILPTQAQLSTLGLPVEAEFKRAVLIKTNIAANEVPRMMAFLQWRLEKIPLAFCIVTLDAEYAKLILFLGYERTVQYTELLQSLSLLIDQYCAGASVERDTSIAVSRAWNEYRFAGMLREAETAIRYTFFYGPNSLIESDKLSSHDKSFQPPPHTDLLAPFTCRDADGFMQKIEELFSASWHCDARSIPKIKGLAVELLFMIIGRMTPADRHKVYESHMPLLFSGEGCAHLAEYLDLLYNLYAEHIHDQSEMSPCTQAALRYMDENYTRNISISDIAAVAKRSNNNLSSVFRREYGDTIINYLNKIRIENAKRLIAEDEGSLYDVAKRCGYNNYSYFTRTFKALTGISPSAYRSEHFLS